MDGDDSSFDRTERLIAGMLRIAAWPRSSNGEGLLGALLGHAADVLAAPRLLLVWDEVDEPWLHLALLAGGGLERWREAPTVEPLVDESLARASFLATGAGGTGAGGGEARVERICGAGLCAWHGRPINAGLAGRFAMDRVASWPLAGEIVRGRLFALDAPGLERDHLVLGEIVAGRLAAELDRFHLSQQLRAAAATEERVRLAWDLHDGVLQSLAGTALNLQALARLIEESPPAARAQLAEVQRLIAADQRDLRFYIEELKPSPRRARQGESDLATRLRELADRLGRLSGLSVDLCLGGIDGRLPELLSRQLHRLVREALFNVARHAGASSVRVEISIEGQGLAVTVTDDGRGFPFKGRFEHDELCRRKLGPVSLKERITALGGSLAIDSGPGRTRVEMRLPMIGAAGAAR